MPPQQEAITREASERLRIPFFLTTILASRRQWNQLHVGEEASEVLAKAIAPDRNFALASEKIQ